MSDNTAERRTATGDLVAGIVLLAVSAVGGWSLLTNKFLISTNYGKDPGPALLPILLIALLALSAVALIAIAGTKLIRMGPSGTDRERFGATMRPLAVPVLMTAILLVYSQSMDWLGFLESTAAFAVFWTVTLGLQEDPKPAPVTFAIWLIEGAAICAGIYAVFAWFIKVPLP